MERIPVKLEPGEYREDLTLYIDESDLDDDEDATDIELLDEDSDHDFNELGVGKLLKEIAGRFDHASKEIKTLSCKFPSLPWSTQLYVLSHLPVPDLVSLNVVKMEPGTFTNAAEMVSDLVNTILRAVLL